MIIASNITKHFGKLTALDQVSVSFNRGTCVALIGPNGSGKTTLIKTILGMVIPDSGFLTFNDQNILRSWQYREKIGYMPQIGRYPEHMTIGQLFAMMKDIRNQQSLVADETLVHEFGLHQQLNKRLGTLSGGTRQKVSACLSFMFQPDVLILDEPTAGLDPVSADILKQKIDAVKAQGKLVIITSHVLSELDDLVTHVAYMQDGKLLHHLSTEEWHEQTGEERLSRAMTHLLQKRAYV